MSMFWSQLVSVAPKRPKKAHQAHCSLLFWFVTTDGQEVSRHHVMLHVLRVFSLTKEIFPFLNFRDEFICVSFWS